MYQSPKRSSRDIGLCFLLDLRLHFYLVQRIGPYRRTQKASRAVSMTKRVDLKLGDKIFNNASLEFPKGVHIQMRTNVRLKEHISSQLLTLSRLCICMLGSSFVEQSQHHVGKDDGCEVRQHRVRGCLHPPHAQM